jgi:mannose-6-phosphate isomerase-like protein (cupin superfamily)
MADATSRLLPIHERRFNSPAFKNKKETSMSEKIDIQLQKAPARTFYILGDRIERRARLEGNWLNIFDVTVPPGHGTPVHSQASPEVYRVLEGRLKVWLMTDTGEEEFELETGDIVTIPAHVPHAYSNPGSEPTLFSALVDKDVADFIQSAGTREPPEADLTQEAVAEIVADASARGIIYLAA